MVFVLQNNLGDKAKDCSLGVLIMDNVLNTPSCKLDSMKLELENHIRDKYGKIERKALKCFHPIDAYVSYYKGFGYTYHVLLQLESIIKGKPIPKRFPLVEAMFMAELKNMLLTAGHDLNKIIAPLCLNASTGYEKYITINGKDTEAISRDILISDHKGVISSILRGPDLRTSIDENTRQVLYTVYAPSGIKEQLVYSHLNDIEAYVLAFSEKASSSLKQVY